MPVKTKSNLLVKSAELDAVEPSKAQQIRDTFMPMADMLEGFEDAFNQVMSFNEINEDVTRQARELRLSIWRVGVDTEKTRKAQKEQYLRAGKAIDAVSNILKWAIQEKVDKLKEVENYFEIQEQKRLDELQKKRAKQLSPYVEYAEERVLNQMDEDVWKAFLETKKKEYKDRIDAEKKAEKERLEKERIAKLHEERKEQLIPFWQFLNDGPDGFNYGNMSEKEFTIILKQAKDAKSKYDNEQEKIRKENERLRKEQKEKEIAAEKERKRLEAIEKKKQEEYEAKLKMEQKEKARIQAQLKAREEAEAKTKEEAERKEKLRLEREKQAAMAPDKDKLLASVNEIEVEWPKCKSKEAAAVQELIANKLTAYKQWAKKQINEL